MIGINFGRLRIRERQRFGTTSPKALGKASRLQDPMLLCISLSDARSQKVEVRRSKAMSKVANDWPFVLQLPYLVQCDQNQYLV